MTNTSRQNFSSSHKKKENGSSNSVTGGSSRRIGGNNNTNSSNNNNASSYFESTETTKQFNDRFDYLLINSIGSTVVVTVNSGIQYEGLLLGCNLESKNGLDVIIKYPKVIRSNTVDINDIAHLSIDDLGETIVLNGENVAELELKNIDLTLDDKYENDLNQSKEANERREKQQQRETNNTVPKQFKTDIDISRADKILKERELQKWVPDEPLGNNSNISSNNNNNDVGSQTLEESSTTWDQFSVNEQKFGIKSSYDEHFYTTKINKNDPNYEQRLKEAQKLAIEIESQGPSGNIHLAEDRGIIIDDSGMDEEDLYSGVDRRGDELLASLKTNSKPTSQEKTNKYVPPTLRNQPHHMDPAIISSTAIKNVPSVSKSKQETSTTGKHTNVDQKKTDSTSTSKDEKKKEASNPPNNDTSMSRALHREQHGRESPKPRIPLPSTKEAQIEELKKFSQKFKVPYDVPKDMKNVVSDRAKSPSQPQQPVPLKSAPSLPPKPSHPSRKDSKHSGEHSSHSFSSSRGNSSHSRRRTPGSFFSIKKSAKVSDKRDLFEKNFNFFTKSKELHDKENELEPFFLEKPYFTAPTWNNTVEESYKTLFPDERTAFQQAQIKLQQRRMSMGNMSAMGMYTGAGGPNMGIPIAAAGGNGGLVSFPPTGTNGPNPIIGNYPSGMYVPMQPQPMFYPGMAPMIPMMGGAGGEESPSPQATSPHIPPAYMNMGGNPYGYPSNVGGGMPPFQNMMGGSTNNISGSGNAGYKQYNGNYHGHHGNNNYYSTHGHNSHSHHQASRHSNRN